MNRKSEELKEKQISEVMASIENRVRHAYNQGYEQGLKASRQEPKQVEFEGDGYADGELVYDYGKCPSCGWQYEDGDKDWEEPYCCHCGQKLQWFEESEGINETE